MEQHLWHAALQPWEVVPNAPSLAKVTTCAELLAATTSLRKALTVGVGLDTWPSDMSAVVGASGPGARAEKAAGRPKVQRRRAGQRAREREREREKRERERERGGKRREQMQARPPRLQKAFF